MRDRGVRKEREMVVLTTERVKELLKEGKKVAEIAKLYNVTRQAIYHHINRIKAQQKSCLTFPKPKKDYNSLIDWKVYNEGLVKRGEILLDFDLFNDWDEQLEVINENKTGRPYEYPNSFIEFLFQLKCYFKIDYRSLEGITRKLIVFIKPAKKAPDYTTLEIRFSSLRCTLEVYQGNQVVQEIAGDSSGLKTTNRGEYRMNKYQGKRKTCLKLHIMVNIESRQVVSCSVTKEAVRDHQEMDKLISEAERYGAIDKGLFDAGYDYCNNYWQLAQRGIKPVIRPRRTMELEKIKQEIEKGKEEAEKEGRGRFLRLETLKEYLEDEEK